MSIQTKLIDGRATAAQVIGQIKAASADFQQRSRRNAGLAVVLVGEDPASQAYVGAKSRMAKECGFHSVQIDLPAQISHRDLAEKVRQLNEDDQIDGILVQLPLPAPLQSEPIIQTIAPQKDVDGLTFINAGKVASGAFADALLPCTPAGAMHLVAQIHGKDLSGLRALVIGRSNLFGKPMGQLLLAANATVTMAHSRSGDLAALARHADVLVAAVGRAHMVKGDWIRPGATIIDVGINRVDAPERGAGKTKLVGDCDFDACLGLAGAMTPVPGGVGPMTIAMLMANTLTAAFRRQGLVAPQI